ncbi:MAG: carotenoid cleavage oxygenase [Acidimicrobiaceae bacterium]|jgi:carotenoid cleavage dioxygenase
MTTANRYLEGAYAPVTEEVTVTDLPVTGTLPAHLDGRYLRNGPNPVTPPDPATYHWFTGEGMVHGIRLRDGKAEWYRNRYVRNGVVADALGEPRHDGPIHAEFDFAANTNVIGHAGRTYAIVEAGGNPYELTFDLDTVGPCDFDGTSAGGYTAHPKRDPATGELHAVSYFFGWGDQVRYSVIDAAGRMRKTVDVPTQSSPMLHDMSLTERYAVIYDMPVRFDIEMAMEGSGLPYSWDPALPARIGLLPRAADTADDVRWFEVEPCYVFHPMNAYDDGDRVVLDVVRHPRMFDRNRLGPDEGSPTLDRWTVDLAAGKVLEERIDERGQEFPRVDERLVGRRHRYGYAVGAGEDAEGNLDLGGNAVIKHDLAGGGTQTRAFTNGSIGEVVFVPNGPDAAEDDGVLLGFAYDGDRAASDLVVLDAATLDTVATVSLPVRVPHGFHGNWVASDA